MALVFILFFSLASYLDYLKTEDEAARARELARQQAAEEELAREKAIQFYENEAAKREIQEKEIYSFLQGPVAWEEKKDWSGKWAERDYDGNPFGGFGCGLCCIANIYCTLSGHEASPWRVFHFAQDNSPYSPTGSVGAIDWKAMKISMKKMGLEVRLAKQPFSFEKFQKNLTNSRSAICLVCSDDDDTFWPSTGGHYVNVWLYNAKKKTVFIAEPGNNVNNRLTIPAEYVYKALKSNSDYQVLYVDGYDASKDTFKPKEGIRQKWIRPKYVKKPANSKY